MSTHIGAAAGEVAPVVLMPGDPLRARWIAETFLDDARCYTEVRGMLGFTGTWRGRPVSVQGSGMGQPSMAIYVNELFSEYDVQSVVRVGSCGALTEALSIRDVVIASGACTDSSMNRIAFEGLDYAPVADFGLLRAAVEAAESRGTPVHVGLLFSSDSFYAARPELTRRMTEYGVLAVEISGILGVDLQLLDDTGFQGPQFRPNAAEFRELRQGEQFQRVPAHPVLADDKSMDNGLIGGQA